MFIRLANWSADELRELGEDIKKHGLKQHIALWSPGLPDERDQPVYLLDGRNRLDAMELVGIELVKNGKLASGVIYPVWFDL